MRRSLMLLSICFNTTLWALSSKEASPFFLLVIIRWLTLSRILRMISREEAVQKNLTFELVIPRFRLLRNSGLSIKESLIKYPSLMIESSFNTRSYITPWIYCLYLLLKASLQSSKYSASDSMHACSISWLRPLRTLMYYLLPVKLSPLMKEANAPNTAENIRGSFSLAACNARLTAPSLYAYFCIFLLSATIVVKRWHISFLTSSSGW